MIVAVGIGCDGRKTVRSIPLHQRIMADPDFSAGNYDTHFIESFNQRQKPA